MTALREELLAPVSLTCAGIAVLAAACLPSTGGEEASAEGWVGTITTEGEVTTVINESGSVWGGEARLIEEVSIGVESGADEYMFGAVEAVWATDDRILVVDSQIPTVRVYDFDGRHLFDVGRRGQGPGEFTVPSGLGVNSAGDLLVIEASQQVDVFTADGEPKATWNSGSPFEIGLTEMIVLGFDDQVWVPRIDQESFRFGWAELDHEGNAGEPFYAPDLDWEPRCLTYLRRGRESRYCNIPYQPFATQALTRDGGWVIGTTDAYAFDVHQPDGSRLHVERTWEPVPVSAEEVAYHERKTTAFIRERADGGAWNWNGPEIPDHKPAYLQLFPDRDGRFWVLREQASRRATDCPDGETECWIPHGYWLDAFGADGRFLGTVSLDTRPPRRPFIDGTTMVAVVMDDAGTILVKRYRLSLPGGERWSSGS